jgi:hypothetical protein
MEDGGAMNAEDLGQTRDACALRAMADSLGRLTDAVREREPEEGLKELVARGGEELVGATWGSVTVLRRGVFRTLAASDPVAEEIDLLQYDLGTGPCVDAVLDDAVYLTQDVRHDPRWEELGRRLHARHGVRAMLAFRLHLLDETEVVAALNFSSDQADAFSPADVERGRVLATHCALLVTAHLAQSQARNVLRGLQSNREIGVAVGILMVRHSLSREQAFGVLRLASQHSNRKVSDIAREVGDTGLAPLHLPAGHSSTQG